MEVPEEDLAPADLFRVHQAAAAGAPPAEAAHVLERASRVVREVVGETTQGSVGLRFGHRVLVAPVQDPDKVVDIADVDVARRVLLTVGGADPGPEGALLAQVLFLRTDRVVGHLQGTEVPAPTMDVLESVLPALRGSDAARVKGVGAVVLARSVEELGKNAAGLPGESDGD